MAAKSPPARTRRAFPLLVLLLRALFLFLQVLQRNANRFHHKSGEGAVRAADGFLHLVDDIVGEADGFQYVVLKVWKYLIKEWPGGSAG